ncbi:MAG: hypothetical protein EOM14_02500 [Clostridia bacterium]|nr:hypothetical protein [Clostridia bacterium]
MRRQLAIVLAVLISLTLVACEGMPAIPDEGISPSTEPASNTDVSPAPSDIVRDRTTVDNTEREQLFMSFLSDNYNELAGIMYDGIAGIGFVDLDCDGGMEMIMFDAGASAAMGIQLFDIIDGKVECVSANLTDIGENFGGEHFSQTIVNANYFDDFRLMTNSQTGEKFFSITSGNGAVDFSYSEIIKFGAEGENLSLTSVCYKYEDYDENTGDVTGANYKLGTQVCDEREYSAAKAAFEEENKDTDLEVKGVFAWENSSYTDGLDGLTAMAEKALSLAKDQIDLY